MRKFLRSEIPEILTKHAVKIGEEYARKRGINPSYGFQWPQIDGIRINHAILSELKKQTDNHCSYCDYLCLRKGDDTIDHFKPKILPEFYYLVCSWENLYIACRHCQDSKRAQFDNLLLRPDEASYSFNTYFIYNYTDHTISANPAASDGDRQRAKKTVEIFGMNHAGIKACRRHAFERYYGSSTPDINDHNYRFMFE